MKNLSLISFALYCAILLSSCGKDAATPDGDPSQIAFLNTCLDCGNVIMTIDTGSTKAASYPYNSDAYKAMKSLNQTVKITDPTKVTKILEKSLNIADSAYLTFALYNTKAAPELLVFADVLPVNIDTNKTYVRLINLMSDGQTVSVNVNGATGNVISNLPAKIQTGFTALDPIAGSKLEYKVGTSTVINKVSHSFFQKGKIYTVYFVGSIAQPNTSIGKLGNGVFVNR